jgi:hypothetical protein
MVSRQDRPPRLAVALVGRAARRWPVELREQLYREWLSELYAIAGETDKARWARTVRAVRFGASLAVRRPAPAPASPTVVTAGLPPRGRRPMLEVFGAAVGLVVLGTVATMLLVSVPGFILAAAGSGDADPGNLDGLHGLPMLSVGPILIGLGAVLGRRMARGRPLAGPGSLVRATLAVVAAVLCAQLFPVFGEGFPPVAAIGLWAIGLTPVVFAVRRLAHRPRGPLPWLAVALGCLLVVDLAVTAAIWLALGDADAPRAFVLAWFPTAMLDPVVHLPLGPGVTDESARFAIVDFVEFLPHALLVGTAFCLWYVHEAVQHHQRQT